MPDEPSLPEKILLLDAALATARVPHALGGALALAYYALPRATDDIDINLFVSVGHHPRVQSSLSPLGVTVDDLDPRVRADGQLRAWWGRTPVDLFYANLPFHQAMSQATRKVPFANRDVEVISPEHLVVCKAAFNRAQDWVDIENLLTVTDVDRAEIHRWSEDLLGVADGRWARLGQLLDGVLGPRA